MNHKIVKNQNQAYLNKADKIGIKRILQIVARTHKP